MILEILLASVQLVHSAPKNQKYSARTRNTLQAQPRDQLKALKKSKPRGGTGSLGYLEGQGTADGKTESELVDMIKGFRLLIDQEKPGLQRNNYLLGEASGYLALSRLYRLKPQMNEKDRDREKSANRRALRGTAEVFSSPKATGEQQAKALYFGGLAQINIGDYEAARKSFLQSLDLNPKAPQAPAMNLFVSENLFEKENYEEALRQYGKYYKQYNNPQKALAIYKMGWCHLNLERPQQAEKMLVLLAGQKWAGSFADDSIKDLAFISSFFRTEEQAIQFAAQSFSQNLPVRIQYLTELYMYFQNQSTTKRKPLLLAEILLLEKNPANRLKVLIATLKTSQRGVASLEPFADFQRLEHELIDLKMGPDQPAFQAVAADFEVELLTLTKAFADTFFGKVKTPEKISDADLGKNLTYLLRTHIRYFPASKERSNSYTVLLSTCRKTNDLLCTYEVAHEIISTTQDAQLKLQANLDLVRALDELIKKDDKYRNEFLQRLAVFLNEYPQEKNWLTLAKRLTFLLNERKSYSESLPWLLKIEEREKSPESRYRVVWARFELGQLEQVAGSSIPTDGSQFTADLKGLVREANLKLAEKAQVEKRDRDYERYLKEFIRLSDDRKKIDVARQNYLVHLTAGKDMARLEQELMGLSPDERVRSPFATSTSILLKTLIQTGDFQKADLLLGKMSPEKKNGLEVDYGLVLLAKGDHKTFTALRNNLKADDRNYFDGIVALGDPAFFLGFYSKTPPKTEEEKKMVFLALQLQQKKSQPDIPPKLQKSMGSMAQSTTPLRPSRLIKEYADIVYPKTSWSLQRYDKFAQDVVLRVRKARKKVGKDLENRPFEVQKQILSLSIDAEKKAADMITASPLPKELSEQQVAEYKAGLAELAKEFQAQSTEFSGALEKLSQQKAAIDALIIPPPMIEKWPWPSRSETAFLRQLVTQGRSPAALGVIDQLRVAQVITPLETAYLRGGVLFQTHPHQVMADYYKSELEASAQTQVLQEWKEITR